MKNSWRKYNIAYKIYRDIHTVTTRFKTKSAGENWVYRKFQGSVINEETYVGPSMKELEQKINSNEPNI